MSSLSTLASWFTESREGRVIAAKAVEDAAARVAAKRAADAKALADLEARNLDRVGRHRAQLAALAAERAPHLAALADVDRRIEDAVGADMHESLTFSRERDRLVAELEQTADPQISEFAGTLQAAVAAAESSLDTVSERCIDGVLRPVWSNARSVQTRVEAILATRHELARMRREDLSPADVEARIQALKANWPAIESRPSRYAR